MNLPFQWKVAFGILATVLIGLSLSTWLTLRIVRRGWPDSLPADVQTDLLLAFGTALLIAMGVGAGIARRLTRPLTEMTELAKHLATGGLGHRIRSAPPDEVGQLGDVLNQITDQLQAKIHEVSEDRAQLLAMLTAMVEGVMVLDSKGQVLLINPALERMFGLHSQPARGRPYWELIRHHDLNDLTARVLERRTGQTGELSLALSGRVLCRDVRQLVGAPAVPFRTLELLSPLRRTHPSRDPRCGRTGRVVVSWPGLRAPRSSSSRRLVPPWRRRVVPAVRVRAGT